MKSNDIELNANALNAVKSPASTNHNENSTLMHIDKNVLTFESEMEQNTINRKLGRCRGFYFTDGEPLIVIGPHWPFFFCMFSINITIVTIFFTFLWDKINGMIYTFGVVVALCQLGAYAYTALINPGVPKLEYEKMIYSTDSNNLRRCKDCKLWINTEERTYHCYDCDICIEGFDHHCPWTSKCIGAGNIKAFYMFVALTMVLFGYLIFSVSLLTPDDNK